MLRNRFVFAERVEALLQTAVRTQKNCVLFGPGGHAKSEMVETFVFNLPEVKEGKATVFTLAFGEGMTEERLFGGLDMPAFRETGAIKYRVEQSFMAYDYVIFEELFDAPTNVLLSLKDILTSKRFRNGEQTFSLRTKVIFVCTNRSADEVGQDLSSKALLERFPLRLEVRWERYDRDAFASLFERVLGEHETNALLAHICAKTHEEGGWISPRTAIHAAQVVRECGWDALEFVSDVSPDVIRLVREEREAMEREIKQKEIISRVRALRDAIVAEAMNLNSPIRLLQAAKRIENECLSALRDRFCDAVVDEANSLRKTCEGDIVSLQNRAMREVRV